METPESSLHYPHVKENRPVFFSRNCLNTSHLLETELQGGMAVEGEVLWTPPPCGIVLEASGLECHEAPCSQSRSQVDFFGRDSCLDHRQPFQIFKVALTVFISFSAVTFSIKRKLLEFLNIGRNSSKCYPCKHNPGGCLSKNPCPEPEFPSFLEGFWLFLEGCYGVSSPGCSMWRFLCLFGIFSLL